MFKLTDIAVILFITTLVNIFTTYVSWQKRRSNYGLYFAMGMIGITIWTLAAGLDYAAIPIPLKVFFAKWEYVGTHSALALLAVSMILYAGHDEWLKKIGVKILFIAIPISNILLAWTNDWHGWLWSDFTVSPAGNNVVDFVHGPAFIWTAFSGYLMIAIIAGNLFQVAFTGTTAVRKQARLLLLVLMIPVASNLLYLFDAFRVPGVDWTSITFSIACLLMLGALYGLRFLEIIPVARNILIEQMADGILVLDDRGYLVDFNSAAQTILDLNKNDLRKQFQIALARYPAFVAFLMDYSDKNAQEISIGNTRDVFDIHLTSLRDSHGGVCGQLVVIRNVSDLKRAETILRQSEERYQTFLSHSFEAIYRTEFDQPIDISLPIESQIDLIYANAYMAECNQALADMYHFPSVDALIGTRLLDVHGGSNNPINRAAFRRFIEGGYKSINDETIEQDSHGNPVWFLSNTIGIVQNGKLVRMWGTSIDITSRKRIEEELRHREQEFKTLVENSPDAITRFDRAGHYQYVNPARAWYFGRSVDEIQGRTIWDLIGPDEVEEGKLSDAALKHVFENPKEYTVEYQTKTPAGMRWVQSRGTPEFASDGSVESILVITRDITARKNIEDELRQSEEQHRLIVQTAMDGFWLLDSHGQFLQVNDAYCRMSGYSERELLSMNISDLDMFETPEVIAVHMQKVIVQGQDRFETQHRRKDGSAFDVEVSVQHRDGRFFAFLRDVTESKQTQEIVRLRLELWEYASSHSVDELMQMALDEICALTDSPIGFYHFVEEDQCTLSLQAWSTRTLKEFCKAEGRNLHYPINEAGVWVDCVRERRPVIHNDYLSLPHRKGLPAGHADVIRELVAPTMRNDRVVAILGIGNKPALYNEKDVEFVSYIADIVWTIVERKRADEHIRQLNAKLEQLAMTDELTGLLNRRSFFERGAEEIKRCRRYPLPLSLLMIDIDHFKTINDTYGHTEGDHALRQVAEALRSQSREVDVVARLGGEEFGILLPNTGIAEAVKLADRLRSAVAGEPSSVPDHSGRVTLSIGVAMLDEETQNIDHLLNNADTAMYQAKNRGRNRVAVYEKII